MGHLLEVVFDEREFHPLFRYESLETDYWLSVNYWPIKEDAFGVDENLPARIIVRRFSSEYSGELVPFLLEDSEAEGLLIEVATDVHLGHSAHVPEFVARLIARDNPMYGGSPE